MAIVKCLVLITCLLQLSICFASQVIRLTNGEWEPFLSEKLPKFGPSSQVVTEVFAGLGITVSYDFFPWPRAYENARIGRWDGSAIWIKNNERAKFFYFSDPILVLPKYLYHLSTKEYEWTTVHDLKGLVIGVTYSYTYGMELDKALETGLVKASWATSDLIGLKKLLSGRVDLVPLEPQVLQSLLNNNFSKAEKEKISFHEKPVTIAAYRLMLNKVNPDHFQLIEAFNRELNKLKKSGRVEKIYKAILGEMYTSSFVD